VCRRVQNRATRLSPVFVASSCFRTLIKRIIAALRIIYTCKPVVIRIDGHSPPVQSWRFQRASEWQTSSLTKGEEHEEILCFVVAVLAVGVSSARAQDVSYNFAKDAKFSDYKTFKWVDAVKGSDQVDQLTYNQIRDALEAELAKKGLTKSDSDDADLLIGYQTAIGTEKQFNSYSSGWGYGPGWGGGWYRGGGGMQSTTTTGSTSTIYIGTLIVDVYDSKGKDLVWRGTARKTINPKAKPDKQQKDIQKSVAKLLKNYPPPQK
jgi:hypothetical protein